MINDSQPEGAEVGALKLARETPRRRSRGAATSTSDGRTPPRGAQSAVSRVGHADHAHLRLGQTAARMTAPGAQGAVIQAKLVGAASAVRKRLTDVRNASAATHPHAVRPHAGRRAVPRSRIWPIAHSVTRVRTCALRQPHTRRRRAPTDERRAAFERERERTRRRRGRGRRTVSPPRGDSRARARRRRRRRPPFHDRLLEPRRHALGALPLGVGDAQRRLRRLRALGGGPMSATASSRCSCAAAAAVLLPRAFRPRLAARTVASSFARRAPSGASASVSAPPLRKLVGIPLLELRVEDAPRRRRASDSRHRRLAVGAARLAARHAELPPLLRREAADQAPHGTPRLPPGCRRAGSLRRRRAGTRNPRRQSRRPAAPARRRRRRAGEVAARFGAGDLSAARRRAHDEGRLRPAVRRHRRAARAARATERRGARRRRRGAGPAAGGGARALRVVRRVHQPLLHVLAPPLAVRALRREHRAHRRGTRTRASGASCPSSSSTSSSCRRRRPTRRRRRASCRRAPPSSPSSTYAPAPRCSRACVQVAARGARGAAADGALRPRRRRRDDRRAPPRRRRAARRARAHPGRRRTDAAAARRCATPADAGSRRRRRRRHRRGDRDGAPDGRRRRQAQTAARRGGAAASAARCAQFSTASRSTAAPRRRACSSSSAGRPIMATAQRGAAAAARRLGRRRRRRHAAAQRHD